MTATEAPVRSAALDEALAVVEGWLDLPGGGRVLIVGPAGSGKTFLADWLRRRAAPDRRAGICDDHRPDPDLRDWVWFARRRPEGLGDMDLREAAILAPEYERKAGVLGEWAQARGLRWDPPALERLLGLPTDSLTRLRSLAERTARESMLPEQVIRETDVIRTLARLGWLASEPNRIIGAR